MIKLINLINHIISGQSYINFVKISNIHFIVEVSSIIFLNIKLYDILQ